MNRPWQPWNSPCINSCVHALLHKNYHIATALVPISYSQRTWNLSASVKIASLSPPFLSSHRPISFPSFCASLPRQPALIVTTLLSYLFLPQVIILLSQNSHEFCFQLNLIATLNHPLLLNVSWSCNLNACSTLQKERVSSSYNIALSAFWHWVTDDVSNE